MTRTDSLDLDTTLGPPNDVRLPGGTVRYRGFNGRRMQSVRDVVTNVPSS